MLDFESYIPVKVVFGMGMLKSIGENVKIYGKKALIVTTGTFFKENGLVDRVGGYLKKEGIPYEYYSDVSPNPRSDEADKGAAFAKKTNCDVIIGMGGGSAIDAAKCIAIGVAHNEPVWPFWIGEKEIKKSLPVIAVTTTSGTGSHMTQFSVITNPDTNEKPGASSPLIFTKVAIVDPELMVSLPKRMTAATGFDVLAHAIEAYTCSMATPFSDMYSQHSIKIVNKYLRRVVEDGSDREARYHMALADTYSGCAITQGITLCHAISHAVGGVCKTVHGETLAAMTPHTIRHSMNKSEEKFKNIGAWLTGKDTVPSGWTVEDTAAAVEQIINDIGMNIPLSKQGVKKSDFEEIIKGTTGYMGGGCSMDPAAPITAEDVRRILDLSF